MVGAIEVGIGVEIGTIGEMMGVDGVASTRIFDADLGSLG
jgi:hypothetical protein